MFDKLFELIKAIWNDVVPYYIVTEAQMSCVLRFGKVEKVSGPGIHHKVPFIDVPYTHFSKTATEHLSSQTLTTGDTPSKQIVIKAIVRYHICDIQKFTTEVWDAKDAIADTVQGIISAIVREKTWDEIHKGIEDEITKRSAEMLAMWGIGVEKVTLSDLAPIRTFRIVR